MDSKKINSIIEKIDQKDLYAILDGLENDLNKEIIKEIKKNYAFKDAKFTTNDFDYKEQNWISKSYESEINELVLIMNNKDLIDYNGGLKVLIYGETGTGKTSFVNHIKKINPSYSIKEIEWELIVDPKMGQTQINILKLSGDLSKINNNTIIFLDEIDSFVTNRVSGNDLGEYSRIVGSFIKFMDNLPSNIVFFAATNLIEKLDDAIKRRFNIKIKSHNLNLEDVLEIIQKSEKEFILSTQEIKLLNNILNDNNFTFSEVSNFIFNYKLALIKQNIKHNWVFFLNNFKNKFITFDELLKKSELTDNRKREIKEEIK